MTIQTMARGNQNRRLVVLSYGLGVDSTAILLRWILDPSSRDFDLGDLVVITSQTGDEWPQTGRLVERHIYPLLHNHGVRTVQVARAGRYERDGIVILDDTREPQACHLDGAYKLSTEMLTAGTVPQSGGPRTCSQKFKGWVLDTWIRDHTAGQPYEHMVGFELGELDRVATDRLQLDIPGRNPVYPLVEWGWHREHAAAYIRDHLGVEWVKSACSYCPFAFGSTDGKRRTLRRYIDHPDQAMLPLTMEHLAVALNARQGLIAGERLVDHLRSTPGAAPLLRQFAHHLADQPWALYRVRRAYRPRKQNPAKMGNAVRSIVRLVEGTASEMLGEVSARAAQLGRPVEKDGPHRRVWLHRKGVRFPCVEETLTAAPALAPDKTGPGFDKAWAAGLDAATSAERQLELAI